MEIVFDVPLEEVLAQHTRNYIASIRRGVRAIAERRAPEITEWMQANRPWTDRTDQARTTLNTDVQEVESAIFDIVMAHGVEHGWYLEGINPETISDMVNRGQCSILLPAVEHWFPIIVDDIRKMIGT